MSPAPVTPSEARARREMADQVVAEVRQVLAHPGAPRALAAMLSQAVCLGFERAFSRGGVQVEALALEAVRQAKPGSPGEAFMSTEDLLEWAWAIIANVSGGRWSDQHTDWQAAAGRWRDTWLGVGQDPPPPGAP